MMRRIIQKARNHRWIRMTNDNSYSYKSNSCATTVDTVGTLYCVDDQGVGAAYHVVASSQDGQEE
jgi:hypothetical protein